MPSSRVATEFDRFAFPDVKNVVVQEILAQLIEDHTGTDLAVGISRLASTSPGADMLCTATIRIAGVLLLAKTVLPSDEIRFEEKVAEDLRIVREHQTLVDLAITLVAEEAATQDDVFRDRRSISDKLFAARLDLIRRLVHH